MNRLLKIIFFLLLTFSVRAGEVNIAWNLQTDPTLGSYNIYYGVAPHTYIFSLNVGLTNFATVPNLESGVTYYFAVTSVTTNGAESDFSREVTATLRPEPPTINSTSVSIYFGPFLMRESPDLTNWTTNTITGFFNVPIGASNDFFQVALPGTDATIPAKITPSP